MRDRFRRIALLALAAILPVCAPAWAQTLDDPRDLLRLYGAIVTRYQQGSDAAASELLTLGPDRGRMLHELIAQAPRQPDLFPGVTWTPGLLRAAALLHSDIAFRSLEIRDQPTFHRHVDAADRLLQIAERREPSSEFRPRWHVAAGLRLLDAAEIESARAFLARSCELFPAHARVRLACGIVVSSYASQLKATPPDQRRAYVEAGRVGEVEADERRLVPTHAALLETAELHFAAAAGADGALDEARLRLAIGYVGRGRNERAEPLLVPLSAADRPADLTYLARLTLGRVREGQGRYEDAAALYRSASLLKPDAPRARIALAHLLHALGDRAASREIVDRVVIVRLNPPEDPWTRYPIEFIGTPFSTLADLRREIRQ